MSEFEQKQRAIQELLEKHQLDALLLKKVSSFAWATCGAASYVNTATTNGDSQLLIKRSGRYLISNNIEITRLEKEDGLKRQDWEFHIAPWYQANPAEDKLASGLRLGADGPQPGALDVGEEVARLRSYLLPEEQERYRKLCRLTAEAMVAAVHSVQPGQTEYEIAARLGSESQQRGIQPIVLLIASDQRIFDHRHPLPTGKKVERYAMLISCCRYKGLVSSITRLVHFGRLPDDLRHKADVLAKVDAAFIEYTRPGMVLAEILRHAQAAYAEAGFPDEWQLHHQGGPAGYEAREWLATPDSKDVVRLGQVYAWNPSITGTKSEDTILVGSDGCEVMTENSNWPMITVETGGKTYRRPDILEII
ncbi:MAG: M24 family metallopeptidase [Anaerolineaceae bacterium]|nr:M24 family metallopeptidase [Anaerolineaceae bacterium]